MKRFAMVSMIILTMAMGFTTYEQHQTIEDQKAKIERLETSNRAYYEGMKVQKEEQERLTRVNEHYANVMLAR